jgi:hypothetical protein
MGAWLRRVRGGLGGGTRRTRRRRLLVATVASVVALAAILVSTALAVHDETFQLDGDVIASTTTNEGGVTQTVDWDSLFTASGTEKDPLPDGFDATSFDKDFNTNANGSFNTSDNTTFATGSKDTLAITPGWQCNRDNNVNSKIDIMNAYSASYTATSGDEILYFALERNANTGTADVGFWFLQDNNVNCESPGGSTAFTGDHVDGDLLVVSEFTSGGTVSTIQVYRWNDDGPGGEPDGLDPDAVASGVDCEAASTPDDDPACATVNTATIQTPWPTSNKQDGPGDDLRISEFFEGGINLTDSNLGGLCFNTFLADTRSSTSLTATLFDFSLGQLGECEALMATQVSDDGPVTPGTLVNDTATVTGEPPNTPTGDVTFSLCGPLDPATETCETGGDPVGDPVALEETTEGAASATSADVDTTGFSSGTYCFRAEWPGDPPNYPTGATVFGPTADDECFTVQDTSSITTEQKWLPQDTAIVTTGSGADPSGTVDFTLYESDDCSGDPVTGVSGLTDRPVESDGETPPTFKAVTANETYYTTSTVISWSAEFTPDNPDDVTGSTTTQCESSDLTITNNAGPFPPPEPPTP